MRFDNNATDEYGNYYSDLEFQYDAMGNRVRKIEFPRTQAGDPAGYDCAKYTYYLRDAQGNIMSIMSIMQMRPDANCDFSLYLEDLYMYGSDRLGQVKISTNWYSLTDYSNNTTFDRTVNQKFFELTNHLGNVHMTLSDYRRAINDGTGEPAYYSQVTSASEYYPPVGGHGPDFGMLLTEGNYSSWNYRFGFNGKEMDNELKGTGNSYDFGARIYDPRIGRWTARDPKAKKYPSYSSYCFAVSNPLMFIDPDGKDIKLFTITYEPEYYYETAGEASFTTTKTSGLTNEITILAVQDFMDTPEGYAYVAQFANAGDVIKEGDKEYTFKEDGAFKDHDLQFNDYANMSEGSTGAIASATVSFSFYIPGLEPDWLSDVETPEVRIRSSQPFEEGDLADRDIIGVKVKSKINVSINMYFIAHSSRKEQGAGARNAITIGHEAFIHDASKALEALINGNINELNNLDMGDGGKSDHDAYMDNNNGFPKFMNYLNSLRNIYGNDVKEAKKEHDENL